MFYFSFQFGLMMYKQCIPILLNNRFSQLPFTPLKKGIVRRFTDKCFKRLSSMIPRLNVDKFG